MSTSNDQRDDLLSLAVAFCESLGCSSVFAFPPGPEDAECPRGAIVGYVRVSTDEQANDDTHRAQIEALVGQGRPPGLTRPNVIVIECASGADPSRPGLAWVAASKPKQVQVTKIDRLDRNVGHFRALLDVLREHECVLVVHQVPGMDYRSAAGLFVLTNLVAVAEFERALISERTSQGMMARDGMSGLTPVQRARIIALRCMGWSYRAIAEIVSKEFGRAVAHSTVAFLWRAYSKTR